MRLAERARNPAERPRRRRIKGQRIEVGLGLLDVRLPCGPLIIRRRDERTNGKFREGYRRDQGLSRKERRISDTREHDDRAGIEHTA